MVKLIREQDVENALTMADVVSSLRGAFADYSNGEAFTEPRSRLKLNGEILHVLSAAVPNQDALGVKSYTAFRSGLRFHILLYSSQTGELKAIIQAKRLGELRTGGTASLALEELATSSAETGALFGVGNISRGMLEGMLHARELQRIFVCSRNQENAADFCERMSGVGSVDLIPVSEPHQAISSADIVVTATTSKSAVFDGKSLKVGATVAAVGSNLLQKREIDSTVVRRASRVVVESIDQAKNEAGDLFPAIDSGFLHWNQVDELGDIVSKRLSARISDEEIILFKSVGLGLQDVAIAAKMYEIAEAEGLGDDIDI